jgi:hypothetical protein
MRAKCDWGAPLLCLLAHTGAQMGADCSYFRVHLLQITEKQTATICSKNTLPKIMFA